MLKEEIREVMDSKEKEVEAILRKYDFSRSEARCMIFMLAMGEGKSKQIEHAMDLRQPEVSAAISKLIKQGLIKMTTTMTDKKGRPEHIYRRAKSKEAIISDIERKMNRDVEKTIRNINELKKLLNK